MKRYLKNIINYLKKPGRGKKDKILNKSYEIDINNPLKSIWEIYNDIKLEIEKIYNLKLKNYPRMAALVSSNGVIEAYFSKEPKSLEELLESFRIKYLVSKNGIEDNEIYKITEKYWMDPNTTSMDTYLYINVDPYSRIKYTQLINVPVIIMSTDPKYPVAYEIKRKKVPNEDKLIIEASPYIERNKKLYNSLKDALKKFRIDETKIEEIIAGIKNKGRAEINLSEDIPAEEFINIYLEGVKEGFVLRLLNRWKTSDGYGGRVWLKFNLKDNHIMEIWMYPPKEEKMKQLLIDMKDIGMDTKIKEVFY